MQNGWGRNLKAQYLQGLSSFADTSKWITVQDASSVAPVSVLTGSRRYTYNVNGQLNLVQRSHAQGSRHAFVVGARVPGPNVFLDCRAEGEHAFSEPHHRWSVGGLYDNVQGTLAIVDRQYYGTGHGWSGANYVAWNCRGRLALQSPPTAHNFAIGFVGTKGKPPFKAPDGWWESFGQHVQPRSLYLQQLEERLGPAAVSNIAG